MIYKTQSMKKFKLTLALFLALGAGLAHAQDPSVATEFRKPTPGNGPGGSPRIAFLSHRLGTDHAEAITTLDMNNDGFNDILSGATGMRAPAPTVETGSSTSTAPSE